MISVRRPLEDSRNQQALGWSIFRRNRSEMLGHSGATFGFASRLVIDTTRRRAAIAWINGRGDEVGNLISLAIDRDKIQ